jgi:predicted dinucleotide-binding enzyme
MRIGIMGAGNIGGTLGRRWAERGHEIFYGVRNPNAPEVQSLVAGANGRAQAGDAAAAIAFGEVVVLAVPAGAVREAVAAGGDWAGKVLVDATNRFSPPGPPSLTQEIAGWAPGARVVKGFNTAGFEALADPVYGDRAADTFLCGDDADAKATVAALATELGLGAVDVGPLANAPLLDALTRLWASAASQGRGRNIAFALLSR